MKKYLLFLLLTFFSDVAFGQNNYQDVIYLKNGSIIRGIIIEQVPNKSIKIETADRNVFVFQIDEIEKFTKEPTKLNNNVTKNKTKYQSGYVGIVELGYQIGGILDFDQNRSTDRLALNIINGYKINRYFSLGLGTGFRYYFNGVSTLDVGSGLSQQSKEEAVFIPIFADFRLNFTNKNVSPYLSLGIGYSYDSTNNFDRVGHLLNPTAGINFKVSENSVMNFGVGCEIQRMRFPYLVLEDLYYTSRNSVGININVGMSF